MNMYSIFAPRPAPWYSAFITALALALSPVSAAGEPVAESQCPGLTTIFDPAEVPEAAKEIYRRHGFGLIWSDCGAPNLQAHAIRSAILHAAEEGLSPGDYDGFQSLWADQGVLKYPAAFDLALTGAALAFLRDLAGGRVAPRVADPHWSIERTVPSATALLGSVLTAESPAERIAAIAPEHRDYLQLRSALSRYRAIAAAGGWPILETGPVIGEGDRDFRIRFLRERLAAEGDLGAGPPALDPERFDAELSSALRRYQQRHGLDADGRLGDRTVAELNVSAEARAAQIERSMERWRWMPRFLGPRYILVNIPAFRLQLIENGTPVVESRVIVGQPNRPTPRIKAEASGLLLNPSWTIPPTILREDVLPKLRRDPGWLAERNMHVFIGWGPDARELDPALIDWRTASAERFPYVIRQDPGSANALGRLKVEMPNSAGVYLHDTPDKKLFELTNRAKSSGCVRIDRIMDLAVALLGEGWNSNRLESLIGSGTTSMLPLRGPVPVYLAYFPAWVDGAGVPHFSPDIYGLDLPLEHAFDAKSAPAGFEEAMACASDQDPGLD